MEVVSLCWYRHDASGDVQHDLLGSSRDLDLRSNVDPTLQGHLLCVSIRLDVIKMMASELFHQLCSNVIYEVTKVFAQNS